MTVTAGEAAEDDDLWMRIVTNGDYVKKDGTLHNSAFGGKAIAPPTDSKPWSLEFSGRLLSFVVDVCAESEAFCGSDRPFVGLMYHRVEALRSDGDQEHVATGCATDVIYTPNASDIAHGDLVAYGATLENRYAIRDWLQDFIQFVHHDNCASLELLRKAN